MAGGGFSEGLARVKKIEHDNYKQGRSGGETTKLMGPVKSFKRNATKGGGGINRAPKGN